MTNNRQISLFLLLDGARINAPRITYQQDDAPWADWLYRGTRHGSALDVSPFLVEPSANSRLWKNRSDWEQNGIILKTRATREELVGHLRSLISIRLPSGQLSYCRFYSNTRLHSFLTELSETERRVFSGPIEEWENPSPNGTWQSIKVSGDAESKTADEEGWFQLNHEHIAALDRVQTDAFMAKLARHLGLDKQPSTSAQLDEAVKQAQGYGFLSEKDIARYAELALRHPGQINSTASLSILNDTQATNFQKLSQLDQLIAYGGA